MSFAILDTDLKVFLYIFFCIEKSVMLRNFAFVSCEYEGYLCPRCTTASRSMYGFRFVEKKKTGTSVVVR